jgi:hypothetical protein
MDEPSSSKPSMAVDRLETSTPTAITPVLKVDTVGIFWLVLAATWTVVVIAAMTTVFLHRHMPFLRIRALGLLFSAVALMHLWWISVQLGYTTSPVVPQVVDYWLMGILFPFGIGLFQASNAMFLHVARVQRRFVSHNDADEAWQRPRDIKGMRKAFPWLWGLNFQTRMAIFVTAEMVLQIVITMTTYLISTKVNPSFSDPAITASDTEIDMRIERGRGWEWYSFSAVFLVTPDRGLLTLV